MREITGGAGARVAFDPVAGALLPQLADALALGGIVIEYGALAAEQAPFPLFAVLGKRLSVHGYRYKRVGGDPAKLDAATRFVLDGLASGALKPTLDRVFPLDRIADALPLSGIERAVRRDRRHGVTARARASPARTLRARSARSDPRSGRTSPRAPRA